MKYYSILEMSPRQDNTWIYPYYGIREDLKYNPDYQQRLLDELFDFCRTNY